MNDQHRPTANPEYAQAMREIRRSNAAGTHGDRRRRRERTRQSALQAEVKREREAEAE